MLKHLLYIFLIFLGSQTVNSQSSLKSLLQKYNSGSVPYTSIEQLRMDQVNNNVLILDTREKEEFEVSHLKNSVFVGYDDFNISVLDTVSKDKPIVVYCSLGIRSEDIGQKLQKAGFENVENLYGGIFEWKNKGFPVFDPNGEQTEKVHAYSEQWAKWLKNAEKIY